MKKYLIGLLIVAIPCGVTLFLVLSQPAVPAGELGQESVFGEFGAVLRDLTPDGIGGNAWLSLTNVIITLGGVGILGLIWAILAHYRRGHVESDVLPPGQEFFVGGGEPVKAKSPPKMSPPTKVKEPIAEQPAKLQDAAPAPQKVEEQPAAQPAPTPVEIHNPPPEDDEVHPDGPDHIITG